MKGQDEIKNKFERNVKALTLKPALGLGKGNSTVRIVNGLSCEIQEDGWKLKTDMPKQVGGSASAPTPGVLGRAAFGSCLATAYVLWASKLNIIIDSLEINVQTDYDNGGLFGSSDSPAGYSEVRYVVKIKSPHSHKKIEEFLNIADTHSPYLDVFSRAQSCKRELELINDYTKKT